MEFMHFATETIELSTCNLTYHKVAVSLWISKWLTLIEFRKTHEKILGMTMLFDRQNIFKQTLSTTKQMVHNFS